MTWLCCFLHSLLPDTHLYLIENGLSGAGCMACQHVVGLDENIASLCAVWHTIMLSLAHPWVFLAGLVVPFCLVWGEPE